MPFLLQSLPAPLKQNGTLLSFIKFLTPLKQCVFLVHSRSVLFSVACSTHWPLRAVSLGFSFSLGRSHGLLDQWEGPFVLDGHAINWSRILPKCRWQDKLQFHTNLIVCLFGKQGREERSVRLSYMTICNFVISGALWLRSRVCATARMESSNCWSYTLGPTYLDQKLYKHLADLIMFCNWHHWFDFTFTAIGKTFVWFSLETMHCFLSFRARLLFLCVVFLRMNIFGCWFASEIKPQDIWRVFLTYLHPGEQCFVHCSNNVGMLNSLASMAAAWLHL